jgi:hypothetical protein
VFSEGNNGYFSFAVIKRTSFQKEWKRREKHSSFFPDSIVPVGDTEDSPCKIMLSYFLKRLGHEIELKHFDKRGQF